MRHSTRYDLAAIIAAVIVIVAILAAPVRAQAPAAPNPQQRFMGALTTLNPLNTASIVYSGTGSAAVPSDGRKPACSTASAWCEDSSRISAPAASFII